MTPIWLLLLGLLFGGCGDPATDPGEEAPWPTGATASLTIRPAYSAIASAKPIIVDDLAAYVYAATELVAFGNVWEYVDSPNAIRGYSASNGIGPITFQTTSQADPAIGFRCVKDTQ